VAGVTERGHNDGGGTLMEECEPTEICSLADAIARLSELEKSDFCEDRSALHTFPFGIWFRGQTETGLDLEPLVFRAPKERRWDEANVYEHLRLRLPAHEQTCHSAFDWLCLMQHYLVPTRLLDWSESILPALYFAVKEDENIKKDGELVVLNARRLNRLTKRRPTISTPDDYHVIVRSEMAVLTSAKAVFNKRSVVTALEEHGFKRKPRKMLDSFRRPIAVFPRRFNERMTLQSSVFTLEGGKRYADPIREQYKGDLMPDPITLDEVNRETPILKRYRIPADAKLPILDVLFRLGIHEASLFPEVDRQPGYLGNLWWYPKLLQDDIH